MDTERGSIKMFLGPLYQMTKSKNCAIISEIIIFLCLDALSPTLFQFTYPFKIETFFVVHQVPIYVAFIASKFQPRGLVFKFGNRSPKGLNPENMVVEEEHSSCIYSLLPEQREVWACALSCRSRIENLELTSHFFSPQSA